MLVLAVSSDGILFLTNQEDSSFSDSIVEGIVVYQFINLLLSETAVVYDIKF